MIIVIQNHLQVNKDEGDTIKFLDRLIDRVKIDKASSGLMKATWDYLKYKTLFINIIQQPEFSEKELIKI